MSTIADNIERVGSRIRAAALAAHRDENSVQLLAVSKTKPAQALREAYAAGLRDFGENYLQEALSKQAELTDLPLIWHFIGPIQSNKTRAIAEHFAWVHSVDRLKIAQRLSEQRPADLPPLNICIQVNVSGEASKSGCTPQDLPALANAISALPRLKLRGLMAIPEPTEDRAAQDAAFAAVQSLQASLNLPLDTLSMGMSHDLESAIAQGATWVRVGTALKTRIAFIGAGNMAASLIGGLRAKGLEAAQIRASDPGEETRARVSAEHGIEVFADNAQAIEGADVVVLAVKPQAMKAVCEALRPSLKPGQLVVSIAAGITCASMNNWLGAQPIVRCMPNTPALLRQGVSGLFATDQVTAEQRQQAQELLSAVGVALWLDEEQQLDAVTAVSGSGPAYFFLLIEAMTAAGVKLGLPADIAAQLTLQTALGAAHMAVSSDVDAAELRRRVTSPAGTTEAAIKSFQANGFEALVEKALGAAAHRSAEMAEQLGR
eukprot:gene3783-3700_t